MPTTEDYLFQLDRAIRKRGLPALDAPSLKEVHQRLQHPEVLQMLQSGQVTAEQLSEEVVSALQSMNARPPQSAFDSSAPQLPADLTPFAEGGFVNDATRQRTAQLRAQLRRRQLLMGGR